MFKIISLCLSVILATNGFAATSNILNVGNAGMNGTDWADCSSQITPSAGFGTVTNKQIYCRRVGDSLQVRGNFQWGTVAASTVYLEVSSLYTINTSKLPTTTNGTFLGKGHQSDATGAQIEASGIGHAYFYDGSTNNQIFLTRASSSGTATYLKQNGTAFAGGNFESFFIEFPVSGWTSGANQPVRSEIFVTNTSGYGSTNTAIRRFTNIQKNVGSDITYTQSATNGDSFTINTDGVYAISYGEYAPAGGVGYFGISVNSSNLTTSMGTLTYAQGYRGSSQSSLSDTGPVFSTTLNLSAGDVVRPHTSATAASSQGDNLQHFRITKVSN